MKPLVVDLDVGEATESLRDVPQVVVGIGGGSPHVDVVVDDETAAAVVARAVETNPVAATALVLHLRGVGGLDVASGLVAESAVYSTLQGGAEFARWLTSRGAARPATDLDDPRVRLTRDEGLLHITLTRPARRNAVDAAMREALLDALDVAAYDESLAVRLDGEGPTFSSGGDLDEFGSATDPAAAHLLRVTRSPARLLARLAERTTVHLHGPCYGAGVELPAFAGLVIADHATTFTLPEVAMGLIPGAGGTVSITRRIGRQRTAWLALTGATIDAQTALSWGLVDAVTG